MPEPMSPRVTLTGADNGVAPHQLLALSKRYPFVEWGILSSEKRVGTPRYPSLDWFIELQRVMFEMDSDPEAYLSLSLHLCGSAARATLAGDDRWLLGHEIFDRVQLNGYAPGMGVGRTLQGIHPRGRWYNVAAPLPELILQVRSEAILVEALEDVAVLGVNRASILYDPSGGTGMAPAAWPETPTALPGLRMGFAGGIGPATIEQVLREVGGRPGSWVDMESGVRDAADRFDLDKCEAVLAAAARWVR